MRKANLKDIPDRSENRRKENLGDSRKIFPSRSDASRSHSTFRSGIRLTSRWYEFPKVKLLCPYHAHAAESELYLVVSGRGNVRDKLG